MFRGSTPILPIEIEGADLTEARIFLTIENRSQGLQMTLQAPEDFTVTYDAEKKKTLGEVPLTQEQTLALKAGECLAQIRYIFPDGTADATDTARIGVQDILMEGVIAYE